MCMQALVRHYSERFTMGAPLLPPRVSTTGRCEDGGGGARRIPAVVHGVREASFESIKEMEADRYGNGCGDRKESLLDSS